MTAPGPYISRVYAYLASAGYRFRQECGSSRAAACGALYAGRLRLMQLRAFSGKLAESGDVSGLTALVHAALVSTARRQFTPAVDRRRRDPLCRAGAGTVQRTAGSARPCGRLRRDAPRAEASPQRRTQRRDPGADVARAPRRGGRQPEPRPEADRGPAQRRERRSRPAAGGCCLLTLRATRRLPPGCRLSLSGTYSCLRPTVRFPRRGRNAQYGIRDCQPVLSQLLTVQWPKYQPWSFVFPADHGRRLHSHADRRGPSRGRGVPRSQARHLAEPPSDELLAAAVTCLAPQPYNADIDLFVDALRLAAQRQQDEARQKLAVGRSAAPPRPGAS